MARLTRIQDWSVSSNFFNMLRKMREGFDQMRLDQSVTKKCTLYYQRDWKLMKDSTGQMASIQSVGD